jgi:peptidoglycan L-alanyl-D-glutamate endopeptidase CwlK
LDKWLKDAIAKLDPEEVKKIKLLYPPLQVKAFKLTVDAHKNGLKGGVFCSYRSFQEQAAVYAKGRNANGVVVDPKSVVTYTKPGYSWHQWGLAIDWVFKDAKGAWTWSSTQWDKLGAIGRKYMSWGGDWTRFPDRPHFEKTYDLDIEKINQVYIKNGKSLAAVWKYMDSVIKA